MPPGIGYGKRGKRKKPMARLGTVGMKKTRKRRKGGGRVTAPGGPDRPGKGLGRNTKGRRVRPSAAMSKVRGYSSATKNRSSVRGPAPTKKQSLAKGRVSPVSNQSGRPTSKKNRPTPNRGGTAVGMSKTRPSKAFSLPVTPGGRSVDTAIRKAAF